jgi:HK97 family phage major capsid protein
MNSPTTFQITGKKLGFADPHRQERLLGIGNLLSRSGGGSFSLRWPDAAAENIASQRDLVSAPGTITAQMQTFGGQLREHSAVMRAGATAITIPRIQDSMLPSIDRSKKASWVSSASNASPTMDLVGSKPLRLSAFISTSRQLALTSPLLAAGFVEAQLLSAIGAALDDGALNGTGTDMPYGLLTEPDLLTYDCNTSAYTFADICEMERLVSAAHGESSAASLGWLSDPATRKSLRLLPKISGKELPAWPDGCDAGPLGYRGTVSPFAPANTLLFGNFGDLLVLQSGAIEISSDPTRSESLSGFRTLVVTAFLDIVSLNPGKSFVRGV